MITEDYVSFQTAKLLKEKGFDWKLPFIYVVIEKNKKVHLLDTIENYNDDHIEHIVSAPTLQMAMKWLREVHHIFIDIDWDARPEPEGFGNKPYFSLITNMNTNEFYRGKNLPSECASYEEACEAAINYCLENLI